ncbi:hypothetical protein HZH66_014064 [Vespula vulgaris]|uniref:Uncharacterized protein n=1 Tax=Vespula vulgaris TaxID=7454 RepID=A0A834J534_VESVU|nr:hypothetical protein HZH66_014064 [Vespula vulgaris]
MATTEIFQDWDSPHENISSMTRTTTRKTTTRRESSKKLFNRSESTRRTYIHNRYVVVTKGKERRNLS